MLALDISHNLGYNFTAAFRVPTADRPMDIIKVKFGA